MPAIFRPEDGAERPTPPERRPALHMTSVLNVFSAWKGLIDQATTNDEKPTPGYLYNEIAST